MSHALRLVLASSLALALGACGARSEFPERPSIEDLRERAADRPHDPGAQRALAFGELLMARGDAERAGPQIERALELAPDDERLHFVHGLIADLHGEPGHAVDRYLTAAEKAARSDRAEAPFVAEVALVATRDLGDTAPGYAEAIRERVEALLEEPGSLGPAAVHAAGALLIELAYRRGDGAGVRALAEARGCITDWGVAGPFGPRALLGFDRPSPAQGRGPLADAYDLGPGRGRRATREVEARGCAAHLGAGPVAASGTTIAEASVSVERGGAHVLRLETPNAVELSVDGERVARLDRRRAPTPRISFHRVELSAGRHEIEVKVTSRHPNPILVVSLTTSTDDADLRAGRVLSRSPFDTYLRAAVGLARGDVVGAREALRGPIVGRGAASAVLQLRAAVALSDPLRPGDMQRDAARRFLRRAARRDEASWYPVFQLARLESADGRVVAAIDSLREAAERWPDVVTIPLSLHDLLLSRGWEAQAEQAIGAAARIAPDACRPKRAALGAAERRSRFDDVRQLARELVECDARSNAAYQDALRRRDWDAATQELGRLEQLEPRSNRLGILSAQLEVANARGADDEVDRLLAEMRRINPRSSLPVMSQTDRLLAQGRTDEAQQLLTDAVAAEPASLAELHFVNRALGGPFPLSQFRRDGAEVLEEFQQSGRSYDQPSVLLFDYTVVRVFPDGSSLELTHNIWSIQSEEAVDARGEFSVPQGARLLALHTIKADGQRIEPDEIAGKDTISLPQLAPGDFVEYEYVNWGEPPPGFPGGFLGDRFYFRSFETPFDLSQLTLVLPEQMEPAMDPRGPAPETEERREDGLRVLRWTARESRPLVPEPQSIAPREFIPSINVGVGATWERFVDGLLDILADKDVRDPAAHRQTMRILGEARNGSDEAKARRLYAWVANNVENNDDGFGLAPAMLAERTGNRARVLRYMLSLAGVDAKLVLARTAGGDATVSDVADGDTYKALLVMLGEGDDATFLSTTARGAPYGYMPPLLRGQEALVLAPGAARVRLPEGDPRADGRSVEVEADLSSDGAAQVRVVETFRGAGAVSWRGELEGVPAATLEQVFEEQYVSRLVPGATLSSLRITGREDAEQPLVFDYGFEVSSLGRRQGGEWIVPGLFPTRLSPVYARAGARTTTQLVTPPIDLEVDLTIRAPDGAAPRAPEDTTIRGPEGARVVITTEREGSSVTVRRRVRMPIMRVPAGAYEQFAGFCRAVDEAEARAVRVRM